MSTRYFLVAMERGPDKQLKTKLAPTWAPRHLSGVLASTDKWESMGNTRRFMLCRVTAPDATLDALDALPGVVELTDTINPARLNRIQTVLATR